MKKIIEFILKRLPDIKKYSIGFIIGVLLMIIFSFVLPNNQQFQVALKNLTRISKIAFNAFEDQNNESNQIQHSNDDVGVDVLIDSISNNQNQQGNSATIFQNTPNVLSLDGVISNISAANQALVDAAKIKKNVVAGQAYIEVSTKINPVTWVYDPQFRKNMWNYTISLKETNGVGVQINEVIETHVSRFSHGSLYYDHNIFFEGTNGFLNANGTLSFTGGCNVQELSYIIWTVKGTDVNNNNVEYQYVMAMSQNPNPHPETVFNSDNNLVKNEINSQGYDQNQQINPTPKIEDNSQNFNQNTPNILNTEGVISNISAANQALVDAANIKKSVVTGVAYIEISTTVNPVTWIYDKTLSKNMWYYTIALRETNGIGVLIDEVVETYINRYDHNSIYNKSDIFTNDSRGYLSANGSLNINGGLNVQDVSYIIWTVKGTDQNQNKVEYQFVFALSQYPTQQVDTTIITNNDYDTPVLKYNADFEVKVAEGVYWVPAVSLGKSRYTNAQVANMLSLAPEQKQESFSTLYEALQLYQVGSFSAMVPANIHATIDGIRWEFHMPGKKAVEVNAGDCSSSSAWLGYILKQLPASRLHRLF